MIRNILRVIVVVLSSRFVLPQTPVTATPREVLSSTLGDMRGRPELIDTSRREDWADPSMLWFSLAGSPMVSPGSINSLPRPAREPSSAGTVSVQHLRHHPSKAARWAYEKGIRSKNAVKAASELEKAIALDPGYGEAHADLGVAYTRQRRYPEAEAEFRRAIELIPEEPVSYSNLGWVLFVTGQHAEAGQNVRRALQLSPDNASAHMLAGCLLIEIPETRAEGLQHLQYAARVIPDAERILKANKEVIFRVQ